MSPELWSQSVVCGLHCNPPAQCDAFRRRKNVVNRRFSPKKRPDPFFAVVCAVLLCGGLAADEGPAAKRAMPAGGQVGLTHEVEIAGKFPDWPVQVWSESKDLTIEAAEKSGNLRISVLPDATPGVRYYRLFNDKGATGLIPFIVDRCPDQLETEPNDHHNRAQRVEGLPVAVHGHLAKSGDVDTFSVELQSGQTLVASIDAQRFLRSPMDVDLQLLTPQGIVLTQQFDHHGLDPELVFTAREDGTYLVRVLAFPETPDSSIAYAGGENFSYRLMMTTGAYLQHAVPSALSSKGENRLTLAGINFDRQECVLPAARGELHRQSFWLEPAGMQGFVELPITSDEIIVESGSSDDTKPMPIAVPSITTGAINHAREHDRYTFSSGANQRWKVTVDARSIGSQLDCVLEISGAEGKQLASNDDTPTSRDSELSFVAPADGQYTITVRDMHQGGGPTYWYRLRVQPELPSYRLTTPTDQITGKINTPIEIVVDIQRALEFSHDIAVDLEAASAQSIHAQAVSKIGDETGKSVKLTLQTERAFSGPIRIVGRSQGSEHPEFAKPDKAPMEWLWLTIVE